MVKLDKPTIDSIPKVYKDSKGQCYVIGLLGSHVPITLVEYERILELKHNLTK